jgi:hypothetical protein
MPQPYTAPTLIDQQKTLTTGFLSRSGYLLPNTNTMGTTGWTSRTSKDLDITITSIIEQNRGRMILRYYDFKGGSVEQTISLVSMPSNLGKGLIWYFICPFSFATCRNLIFVNNRFMHRSNLRNPMYSIQAESKRWRRIFQIQPNIPKAKAYLGEPLKKNYQRTYKGKKTKRYAKYLETIKRWENGKNERRSLLNY